MPDGLNTAAEAAAFVSKTLERDARPKLLIMPHDPDLTYPSAGGRLGVGLLPP